MTCFPRTACIYYYGDDDSVFARTIQLKEEETLEQVKERITKEDVYFDDDPEHLKGFMLDPTTLPWLEKIQWPKSPYDDFDTVWNETVDQCRFSVYEACKLKGDK